MHLVIAGLVLFHCFHYYISQGSVSHSKIFVLKYTILHLYDCISTGVLVTAGGNGLLL